MIVTTVIALSAAMIATPVMAQNMTGGNMTGKSQWRRRTHNVPLAPLVLPEIIYIDKLVAVE
jgi:hypothetical protein